MKIKEITSVGPGSTIQMVKVSEEYFLIGVTKTNITLLAKLEYSEEDGETHDGQEQTPPKVPFEKYLKRIFKHKGGDDDAGED